MIVHQELKSYDYIIVGQGIAGSMLAHFLLQQNKKILVIDEFNPSSSSNIAAGVVNPITGRKMVKSWLIDDLLPLAKSTYKALEEQLDTKFFYEQDIYKLFTSNEDIEIWKRKKNVDEYKNYLGEIVNDINQHINTPFGVGIIRQSCWMDVPVFIKAYRNYLKENNCLLEESLDINDLKFSETIQYKNIVASKIIFCEGFKVYKNPFFNFVKFSFAKGEQFTIHAPDLKMDKMLNKNISILPKHNNTYSVGSTFIWDDLEEKITENGRKELNDKLNKIITCNYTVIEEKAAIRPTMLDRRPVIGEHQHHKNLFIFNGLGTKGVSLAPYFSQHIANHFVLNQELMNDVALSRFFDK